MSEKPKVLISGGPRMGHALAAMLIASGGIGTPIIIEEDRVRNRTAPDPIDPFEMPVLYRKPDTARVEWPKDRIVLGSGRRPVGGPVSKPTKRRAKAKAARKAAQRNRK